MEQQLSQQSEIGVLLNQEGLLTEEQLTQSLEVQKTHRPALPLGQVCVELGFLSPAQLGKILSKYHQRIPLGEFLVYLGLVTQEQIEAALEQQQREKPRKKLGALLVEKGWLDETTLIRALYQQAQLANWIAKQRRGKFDMLVTTGRLNQKKLDAAVATAQKQQRPVEAVLMEQYGVTKQEIGYALSAFYQCDFIEYDEKQPVDAGLVRKINPNYLKANYWIPLRAINGKVEVLIDDPHSIDKIQDIKRLFPGKEIKCAVGLRADILKYVNAINLDLSQEAAAHSRTVILGQLKAEEQKVEVEESTEAAIDENSNAIVRLVNQTITDAYNRGASDIHIEPYGDKNEMMIRFRVDGVCHEYLQVPAAYRRALVSRLKIMARLDISERRKPQDGKIRFRLPDREIELRAATIPTAGSGNEDVVLRILTTGEPRLLDQLHLTPRNLRELKQLLEKPYGLILSAGPTGSGKTTTLHSALAAINTASRKIWTAEDPVEITQRGLRQVQVNPKIGYDFASAMRAFLRADPDVIMIGEVRDRETAEVCIEASLTGHLVLSTLHTNSAVETITRLLEMDMDPFNFADALLGVLAQRLARTICSSCKESYRPSKDEYNALAYGYGEDAFARLGILYDERFTLYRGKGCASCQQSGYRGRIGLHELLVVTDEIRRLIHARAPMADLLQVTVAQGMTTLVQDGILKVLQGRTDYKQVRAVAMR